MLFLSRAIFLITRSTNCKDLSLSWKRILFIHITIEVRIPFRLLYCRTNYMQGNFDFVYKGPKYLIPVALKLRMIVVLLCSILNLSKFSWYKHTLVLLMLVCSFTLLSLCLFFFSYILALFFFSPLISFFVFALARSVLSIFVLFNDYYSMF